MLPNVPMNDFLSVMLTICTILAIAGWTLDRYSPRPGRVTVTEDDTNEHEAKQPGKGQ